MNVELEARCSKLEGSGRFQSFYIYIFVTGYAVALRMRVNIPQNISLIIHV